MKNKLLSILLLLAFVVPIQAQLDRSKMPKPGPAPEILIGKYQSFQLKNGLKVFVVENHKLPVVTFRLIINRDPILEGDHAGYVNIAGQLLRRGTKTRTKAQIDEAIDFIGANLYTSSTSVTASSLTDHVNTLLNIMSDIVLNSDFKQSELNKLKKQTLSALAAEKDDPNAIANNVRKALIYGKNFPYGEQTTPKTVKSITLQLCKNYYHTYFKPNDAYLAIVGDITERKAKELTKKYFGSWKSGKIPTFKYKTPRAPIIRKVALVDRPNSVQSVINITYPVILKKNSSDVIPASVMNAILGGSFASRLNQNLREAHGYTYGAHSVLASDKLVGQFDASCQARNTVTDSAITQFFYEINKMRNSKVTLKELKNTKMYIAGVFSRSLENPQTVAKFALNIAKYKLPKDYYKNYLKNLDAVTVNDVYTMAKKYLRPNNAYVLVVGSADKIASKLKKFSISGQVQFYDTYGNKFNPSMKKIPKGVTGKTIINNYIKAIGGRKNILKVKDKTTVLKASVRGMNMTLTISEKVPNKYYQSLDAGVFKQKTVFDGTKGYQEAMGQKKVLSGESLKAMKIQANMHVYLDYAKLGIVPKVIGTEKVNGEKTYKVELKMPWGKKWIQYFSVKTGLLMRQVTPIKTSRGTFNQVTDFSNYKDVQGVKYPFTLTQQMGPQSLILKVDSIKVNSGLSDDLFKID